MRAQQRTFANLFRKSYRHQRPPRLDQIRAEKKRQRIRAARRQKTDRLRGDAGQFGPIRGTLETIDLGQKRGRNLASDRPETGKDGVRRM